MNEKPGYALNFILLGLEYCGFNFYVVHMKVLCIDSGGRSINGIWCTPETQQSYFYL
jgi:hypothetical protein